MSRLLDQLRNAALTRLGNTSQENGSSPAVPADVNTASPSSSLLVQAIQGSADVGRKTLADEAAQARAVTEQRAQAEADACVETEREDQRATSATPRSDQVARHHHLPRIAIAAMIAAGMFGLGYWTGLPDRRTQGISGDQQGNAGTAATASGAGC